jgi:hypothetical protein
MFSHSVLNFCVEQLISEFLKEAILPVIVKEQMEKETAERLERNRQEQLAFNPAKNGAYFTETDRAKGLIERADQNMKKHSSNE